MSSPIALCIATMKPEDTILHDVWSWIENGRQGRSITHHIRYNTPDDNLGVVGSYQRMYGSCAERDEFLCYLHDDVVCKEPDWDIRVLKEFENPNVALVGFGGAKWHGVRDLYKVPYKLQNLIRGEYLSNVDDAEVHGSRFTGSCSVSVLDGFAIVCRRSFLDRIGDWSWAIGHCDFFCYDYGICAMARRCGMDIRVIGVRCHHRGGVTSVTQREAVKERVGQDAYDKSHRWFYEEFKDVMPWSVK